MPWSEEDVEEVIISPGSGQDSTKQDNPSARRHGRFDALRRAAGSCCRDNHYRRLAIFSIMCGLSCIGIIALKYSVKAKERQRHDPESAAIFARKAKKFSIISIVTLFVTIGMALALMALVSYLATLKD
ncbi:hypothetical protein NQD34_005960 [Periophthalmus magnuspinnatus]|uniref:transmembrane protein 265-like n=1 Tax=Periophthalmus magnuspinnatus TaxID=409849 RepID=UPI00145BD752|nr:transmembrane protein 265-like [Periophthalmus magnuspinnatus]KAJ0000940.1 hypothetical protein NQD34_005960 [Periophthalmus magnuspinnatus]